MKADFLAPGAVFGRYRIVRGVGAGGMGAVFEATHIDLKKRVAVKALHPSMAKEAEVKARFLREGQAAARIRHPHVVDIYDVGSQDGIPYLVMELLEGEDLGALLRRGKALSAKEIAEIMLPACAAVSAAHQGGVLHRDLKPANIFLARGPHGEVLPKILDFGISKIVNELSDVLTHSGAVLGTPYYMSPEQAHGGRQLDAKSDQYSLGVVLYQCVTGKRPFDADSMYQVLHKIVQGKFERPRALNPQLPPALEAVILRAMALDPADRFPSVQNMGAALLPVASERLRAVWEPAFGGSRRNSVLPRSDTAPPSAPFSEPPGAISQTQSPVQEIQGMSRLTALSRSPGLFAASLALFALVLLLVGFVFYQRSQPVTEISPVADVARTGEPEAPVRPSPAAKPIAPVAPVELLGPVEPLVRPTRAPHETAKAKRPAAKPRQDPANAVPDDVAGEAPEKGANDALILE